MLVGRAVLGGCRLDCRCVGGGQEGKGFVSLSPLPMEIEEAEVISYRDAV